MFWCTILPWSWEWVQLRIHPWGCQVKFLPCSILQALSHRRVLIVLLGLWTGQCTCSIPLSSGACFVRLLGHVLLCLRLWTLHWVSSWTPQMFLGCWELSFCWASFPSMLLLFLLWYATIWIWSSFCRCWRWLCGGLCRGSNPAWRCRNNVEQRHTVKIGVNKRRYNKTTQ